MKILLSTLFVFFIGAHTSASHKEKPVTYILEFDETGKLISEPPVYLKKGDKLKFKVAVSQRMLEKRALELYKSYFETYQNIESTRSNINSINTRGYECLVDVLKKELAVEMSKIVTNYPTISETIKTLKNPIIKVPKGACFPDSGFIPKADTLIIPTYAVITSNIGKNGVVISEEKKLIGKFDLPALLSDLNNFFLSDDILVEANQQKVRYELRQVNNYSTVILEQLKKHPIPEKLTDGFSQLKKHEEEYNKIKESYKNDPPILLQLSMQSYIDKLETGSRYIDAFVDLEIISWLLHFAWLNDGQILTNPFAFPTKSFKTTVDISAEKESLQNVVDKIALLKDILKNDAQLQTYDGSRIDDYITKYNLLQEEHSKLKKEINEKEKKEKIEKDKVDKSNENIISRNNRLVKEPWLYHGLLFVSDKNKVFTRYHDASDGYKLMNRSPVKEILDGQRMVILVENENPSNKVNVNYEVKQIDFSLSHLEKEIDKTAQETFLLNPEPKNAFSAIDQISSPQFNYTPITNLDRLKKKMDEFVSKHMSLKPFIDKITKEGIPDLPLQIQRDKEPTFTYKYLDVAIGKNPPYEVPYTIGVARQGKADSIVTDSKLNLSYSVFALHRFRFKIGPTYSSFKKQTYEIKDGVPLGKTEVAGVDAIFGLQVFLTKERINIREKNLSLSRPFAYLGFPISQDIVKNVYLGGGFEIINGLGLCAGLQVGQTSKLRFQNGIFTVDNNRWRAGGPFASILLDLSVFRTLFNFKARQLPNPLR